MFSNFIVPVLLVALAVLVLLVLASGIRFIPNNRIGIVEKRFGKHSVRGGFIALQGEAGYQPDVLRGGIHYLVPFQYAVHIVPLVTIPQGKIGYLFARDARVERHASAGLQRKRQRFSGRGRFLEKRRSARPATADSSRRYVRH
jgi:uncharacterized membrane protein YqiK